MEWCCPGCKRVLSTSAGRIKIPDHQYCAWSGKAHTLIAPTTRDPTRIAARTAAQRAKEAAKRAEHAKAPCRAQMKASEAVPEEGPVKEASVQRERREDEAVPS